MRVTFDKWDDQLQLNEHNFVQIKWDKADKRSKGILQGPVISRQNGTEWVHIMPAQHPARLIHARTLQQEHPLQRTAVVYTDSVVKNINILIVNSGNTRTAGVGMMEGGGGLHGPPTQPQPSHPTYDIWPCR